MNFEEALKLLKKGKKVKRLGNVAIYLQGCIETPIIMQETVTSKKWNPSQLEILAEDWEEAK